MPTFGQDFLKGFLGNNSLRDYQHANRVFATNAYELKPRFKFLFHVSFTLNVQEIPYLRGSLGNDDVASIGLAVKTVDLPKYNVDTEVLNQYNRKRIIQKKINYEPVQVTFHDTSDDLIRKMWYLYMSYYYKDSSQQYLAPNNTNGANGPDANRQAGFGYNDRDIYAPQRIGNVNDWGYIGESFNDGGQSATGKPPFFRDIRIYGMDQRKFAEYVLINPIIKSWNHDTYDYAEGGGVMQNTMTIEYETVKYYGGAVGRAQPGGDPNVQGFATDAHYDKTVSPLARPGANATVFGQGGLLDTGAGIISDLTSGGPLGLIGAVQKAGRLNQTFKGKNLRSIAASEATTLGKNALIQGLPGSNRSVANRSNGWLFPKQVTPTTNQTGPTNNPPPPLR
jgi:hypothetical protein